MVYLLNWRIWVAVIVLALYPAMYLKGSHDRGKRDELERTAAIAQANTEARKTGELRQDRVDEAAKSAAASQRRIVDSAAAARAERDGLRGTLDAVERASAQSLAASNDALRVTAGLLDRCTALYLGVSEDAARADAEARELRAAWPK